MLVSILLANVATRYVTDRHIGSLATAFRQVAPVIAVAESLRYTVVVNASPLLAALHVDVRPLRRLKNVARWIGGDPLLIPFGAGIAATVARDDGELVDLLTDTYAAVHFGDAVGDNGLVFDHRLRPGPATTRNAIALLRIHGAPNALLARASECAALLDVHRGATLLGR